jgi:hypothetical protein
MEDKILESQIKKLVDKHGLIAVLVAVRDVCYDKANDSMFVQRNHRLAEEWENAAKAFSSISGKIRRLKL